MSERPARLVIRRMGAAEWHATADIRMQYLYPWAGVVEPPFGAGWALVDPGETSQRHMHHEGETWFITEGQGEIRLDDEFETVGPGDVVYLPPFTRHALHNPSSTDRLVFLTCYWEDLDLAAQEAARRAEEEEASEAAGRVIVNVAPPTPNGDLHLGHLSGPYLGADVHRRWLRMNGVDARYVMGTDDYQSYVAGKALQTDDTPAHVANHFAERIEGTLRLADIKPDQFTRPVHASGYQEVIQDVFRRLYAAGHLVEREAACLRDAEDGRYLFEFYVGGNCPHCGAAAGGGGCEECGRPNQGHDLENAAATLSDARPDSGTIKQLFVPLSRYEDRIRKFLLGVHMPPHLRALAEDLLAQGLPDVPATHPHEWGLPCPIPGFEDQIISAWVELGHGFLESIRQHDRRAGLPVNEDSLSPAAGTRIVQFFGFDNGFVYALLYPLLYQLIDPDCPLPETFVCNEFYRLDGLKFSTSRDHAVWVRDICREQPSDLVRFYVCYTRPESEQTSFSRAEYDVFVAEELRGRWSTWLDELGQRVEAAAQGVAPEPGFWTDEHRRMSRRLEQRIEEAREGYRAEQFSTRAVTRALMAIVEEARAFGRSESHWQGVPRRANEVRTALALELAAARAVAGLSTPLMPRFAQHLWGQLGLPGDVEATPCTAGVAWVPAGSTVALSGPWFSDSA